MNNIMQLNIQNISSKTWNKIKVNNKCLDWVIPNSFYTNNTIETNDFSQYKFNNIETGCGNDINLLNKSTECSALRILSNIAGKEKFISLSFKSIADKSLFVPIEFIVKSNCSLTVVMDYTSEQENGHMAIQTKFILEDNASLSLIQLSSINLNNFLINDIGGVCNKNSNFCLTQIFKKSANTISGCKIDLLGDNSTMNANIGYYVHNKENLDMNYVISQNGKKTKSNIFFNGALWDGSRKILRDTIDFKKSSSGSTGDEKENVLLLGNDITNQTVPIILCSEEDVVGTHGASIGKIDKDILFYFSTRGISEKMAGKILSDSIIKSLCSKIQNKKALDNVNTLLERDCNG